MRVVLIRSFLLGGGVSTKGDGDLDSSSLLAESSRQSLIRYESLASLAFRSMASCRGHVWYWDLCPRGGHRRGATRRDAHRTDSPDRLRLAQGSSRRRRAEALGEGARHRQRSRRSGPSAHARQLRHCRRDVARRPKPAGEVRADSCRPHRHREFAYAQWAGDDAVGTEHLRARPDGGRAGGHRPLHDFAHRKSGAGRVGGVEESSCGKVKLVVGHGCIRGEPADARWAGGSRVARAESRERRWEAARAGGELRLSLHDAGRRDQPCLRRLGGLRAGSHRTRSARRDGAGDDWLRRGFQSLATRRCGWWAGVRQTIRRRDRCGGEAIARHDLHTVEEPSHGAREGDSASVRSALHARPVAGAQHELRDRWLSREEMAGPSGARREGARFALLPDHDVELRRRTGDGLSARRSGGGLRAALEERAGRPASLGVRLRELRPVLHPVASHSRGGRLRGGGFALVLRPARAPLDECRRLDRHDRSRAGAEVVSARSEASRSAAGEITAGILARHSDQGRHGCGARRERASDRIAGRHRLGCARAAVGLRDV